MWSLRVLAVVCITLSASLAAFALSATHPSAACCLYTASTADSLFSPDVCITLSASLSCICSLDNSAYASIEAFPNVFLATVSSDSPQNVHSNTTMHSYVRLVPFSCSAIDYHAMFPLSSPTKSASVGTEVAHISCSGSIFLFCSLCRVMLTRQMTVRRLTMDVQLSFPARVHSRGWPGTMKLVGPRVPF